MLWILIIAALLLLIEYLCYHFHLWRYTLFIAPTICIFYMVYIIFTIVREQALLTSSYPLWVRILVQLIPLAVSLFSMTAFIIRRYITYKIISLRKTMLKLFVFLLCIVFGLLLSTTYFYQEYVIFYPNDSEADRQYLYQQTTYRPITIKEQYHGWLKEAASSQSIIVFFGGNAQNTASIFRDFEELQIFDHMTSTSFLSVDYPSYGTSEGSLSQTSLFNMAEAVMDDVYDRYPNQHIYIVGYSIGTGIASYAASKYPVTHIALISPYNNGSSLFNSYFPVFYGPLQYLIRYPLTSDEYLSSIDAQILIAYTKDDTIVKPYLSKQLIQACNASVNVKEYTDITHGEMVLDINVWSDIIQFLNK